MSVFQDLGISKDRAGFNAFNELNNPEQSFSSVLETILGTTVKIKDLGRDIDFKIGTPKTVVSSYEDREFLNSLPLNLDYKGLDFEDGQKYIATELTASEFNEAIKGIKVKETAEKFAESENVGLFTKIVKPIGAVMTVITAIITIRKLRN